MQSSIEPPERLKSPPSTDDDLGLRSHPVLSGLREPTVSLIGALGVPYNPWEKL